MHLMLAYKQRSELLNQLTDEFIEKLMAHLSALFYNLVMLFVRGSTYIVQIFGVFIAD